MLSTILLFCCLTMTGIIIVLFIIAYFEGKDINLSSFLVNSSCAVINIIVVIINLFSAPMIVALLSIPIVALCLFMANRNYQNYRDENPTADIREDIIKLFKA